MKFPADFRWQPQGETIGQGGQGQVLAVVDNTGELPGTWALKVLRNKQPGQAYERFVREIMAVQILDHPNVIRVVDFSRPEADFQYYVMEVIEGAVSLERILASEKNPFFADPIKSLALFRDICLALAACESSEPPIVHRDLAPANILICPNLRPKIIDFGLCQVEGHNAITLVDEGVGTVNYMAPECESGSTEPIGTAADLYSAGKVLWSAITGMRAFSRESSAFDGKSMKEIFPDATSTWHLHHIFESTIRRDWRNRWESAAAAARAAEEIEQLIQNGYPPLEQIVGGTCPICGYGKLQDFKGGHAVFGNPNPRGIVSRQCTYCGFCFAFNCENSGSILRRRSELE